MAKIIYVPFIEGLESMTFEELDLAMEQAASKFQVNCNNWPEVTPYAPDCCGSVARSGSHLAVMYHVRGLDLRATALEDNGNSWEDSCCEFFIADPSDGTYYNFELTCIGSLLAAKRTSRTEKTMFTQGQLNRVLRLSTLPRKEYRYEGGPFAWSVALLIPFDLVGVDAGRLPATLKGNFYKCGDLTAHPHFLSWSPVGTPAPDFHRPEFFGDLILA